VLPNCSLTVPACCLLERAFPPSAIIAVFSICFTLV
jgi:hypothetical protein